MQLTQEEIKIIIQVIHSSSISGSSAKLIADLLDKLQSMLKEQS